LKFEIFTMSESAAEIAPTSMSPSPDDRPALDPDAAAHERLRRQFDGTPYPHTPIEQSPQQETAMFYSHHLPSAFYARDRCLTETQDRVILDVGCGSGVKAAILAVVNPGARVVGIDLSPKSIALAQERAAYHHLDDRTEFHVLTLEDVGTLGQTFDYINCDEILYLLDHPREALRAIAAVLKPDGLIRANFHNAYQRHPVYNVQAAMSWLGLRGGDWAGDRVEAFRDLIGKFKDAVPVRKRWKICETESPEAQEELMMANYLLEGDRGYSVPEVFVLLEEVGLQVNALLEPALWEVSRLFRNPDAMPEMLTTKLATATLVERLHFKELLHPEQRLIDFWCGLQPSAARSHPADWDDHTWAQTTVALNPLLQQSDEFPEALRASCIGLKPLELARLLVRDQLLKPVSAAIAPCLVPLLTGPQPVRVLVQHLQQIRPLDPATLAPVDVASLEKTVRSLLVRLETDGVIFLLSAP
jgi:2-polyprenyl-3-methyl-5-hydroxy-6-metoxy-1,4-benzoquinol methylase